MTDLTIRQARPEDAAAVMEIAERGWVAAYGPFLSEETIEAAMEAWYTESKTRERMDRDRWRFLVAERDGAIEGFLNGGPPDSTADEVVLGALYVDPAAWRSGVGSGLMDRFETGFAERGYETVTFDVLAENESGQSFYRTRGYQVVETRAASLFGETVLEHVFEGEIGE